MHNQKAITKAALRALRHKEKRDLDKKKIHVEIWIACRSGRRAGALAGRQKGKKIRKEGEEGENGLQEQEAQNMEQRRE